MKPEDISAAAGKAARDVFKALNWWRSVAPGEYKTLLDAPATAKGK